MASNVTEQTFADFLMPEQPAYNRQELQDTSLRPTLIIGLGGTGEAVVSALQKRLHGYFGEYSGAFQLLAIDTTEPSPGSTLGKTGRLRIGDLVDPDAAIRHLQSDHAIRQWWPWGKEPFRIGQPVMTGAGQTRVVGRLALWFDINKFETRLKHLLKLIGDVTLPVSVGGGRICKIYVVCSLCGGTGSGIFLDVAYLVQHWVKQAGLDPRITGVLVMPDAFETVLGAFPLQMNWVKANAYAALKELEHFTRTEDFRCTYRDDLRVHITGKPFDVCYLVGTRNKHAKVLRDLDTLLNIIAHQIFLEIGTPMGVGSTNNFDNPGAVQARTPEGKPTAFSSFGVGALVHPFRELRYYVSACLAAELLDSILLGGGANGHRVTTKVNQFIAEQRICEDPADDVIDTLRVGAQGQPLQVPISDDLFAGIRRGEVPAEISNHQRAIQDRLGSHQQKIARNAQTLTERTQPALTSQVMEIVKAADEGLPLAIQFLKALNAKLSLFLQEMNEERDEQRTKFKTATAGYERAGNNASKAAHGSFFDNSYKDHLQEWVEQAVLACGSYVGMEARASAAKFFAGLIRDVETLHSRLTALQDTIDSARNMLKTAASRVLSAHMRANDTDYQLVESIIPRSSFAELFAKYRSEHLPAKVNDLYQGAGTPLDWGGLDAGELATRVGDWTLSQVQPLITEDLLQHWKNEGESGPQIQETVGALIDRCAPLWSIDRARFNPGGHLQSTRAVGVGTRHGGEWEEILAGLENTDRVTTHNLSEISVLNAEHGMPLYGLFFMEGLRDTYNMCRRNQTARGVNNPRPLHLHTDWHDTLEDLFPERDAEVLDVWAIGLALDMVYRKGHYYYLRSEVRDGSEDDVQIGQGRVKSFDEFKRQSPRVNSVRAQIDAWLASTGHVQAREVLTDSTLKLREQIKMAKADVKELMQRELRAITQSCEEIESVR